MFNIQFFAIVFLSFLIYVNVSDGEMMSKDEVMNIPLKRTHSKKKCPSYSDNFINFSCQYRFFCRGEVCSTKNKKTSLVEFKNTDGKVETFIPDACPEEDVQQGLCSTAKCYDNDDCLSQRCFNRTCLVNDNSPVIECNSLESYSSFKFKYTGKMHCGRSVHEKCEANEDCASKNCTSTGYCNFTYVDHKSDQLFYQVFEIGVLVFVAVVLILMVCCLGCCYQHKKRKAKYMV